MLYLVYLDEFGHDGPFESRTNRKYKTSPVFGFSGIILPYEKNTSINVPRRIGLSKHSQQIRSI